MHGNKVKPCYLGLPFRRVLAPRKLTLWGLWRRVPLAGGGHSNTTGRHLLLLQHEFSNQRKICCLTSCTIYLGRLLDLLILPRKLALRGRLLQKIYSKIISKMNGQRKVFRLRYLPWQQEAQQKGDANSRPGALDSPQESLCYG